MKHRIMIFGLALSLSGCSGLYKETFDCGSKDGVGCKSIAEVDALVNAQDPQVMGSKDLEPIRETRPVSVPPLVLGPKGQVSREAEAWRRVWIAPFQSEDGTFYEGTRAHVLVRPGRWVMS